MKRIDFDDVMIGILTVAIIGIGFFIFKQMGKANDCRERGGYAVDTSQGWVCAKLERI